MLQLELQENYHTSAFPFSEDYTADEMYLFYNNQGTVSLVTRNYGGNVGVEDQDTMMEYVEQ
ncbi:hypothetical protein ACWOAH_02850 [Vagococcus vulneris]|uniref:Uncharacterized protein n=1 Tax=Vagococcus vulneris TaxID=1977869 RepID=A0A430A0W0_9ENTE|nr:hypothetical protein [Vagococcus vulneris]RSU00013.1 hypothetical protein CBF37_01530 [Vagococcus vulneris]